jgi:hypothetical protein
MKRRLAIHRLMNPILEFALLLFAYNFTIFILKIAKYDEMP